MAEVTATELLIKIGSLVVENDLLRKQLREAEAARAALVETLRRRDEPEKPAED